MGLNLGIRTTPFTVPEDQRWLGSRAGTQTMDPITLDSALCVAVFATGLIPSGIPLTKRGTGRCSPTLAADTIVDYHLFTTTDLTAGGTQAAANTPASGMWQGEIITAKIPAFAGALDLTAAAGQAKSKLFKYV